MTTKITDEGKDGGPKSVKMVYNKVIRKSRAGVEYTHYVPTIEGDSMTTGPNRKDRRRKESIERSAKYQRFMKLQARAALKKKEKSLLEKAKTAILPKSKEE